MKLIPSKRLKRGLPLKPWQMEPQDTLRLIPRPADTLHRTGTGTSQMRLNRISRLGDYPGLCGWAQRPYKKAAEGSESDLKRPAASCEDGGKGRQERNGVLRKRLPESLQRELGTANTTKSVLDLCPPNCKVITVLPKAMALW